MLKTLEQKAKGVQNGQEKGWRMERVGGWTGLEDGLGWRMERERFGGWKRKGLKD